MARYDHTIGTHLNNSVQFEYVKSYEVSFNIYCNLIWQSYFFRIMSKTPCQYQNSFLLRITFLTIFHLTSSAKKTRNYDPSIFDIEHKILKSLVIFAKGSIIFPETIKLLIDTYITNLTSYFLSSINYDALTINTRLP